jgi:undecaprenyl-diphosphatase
LFGGLVDGVTAFFWSTNYKNLIHLPLVIGFSITAGMLWSMRYAQEKQHLHIWSIKNGLILGCAQGFALLPGVSRFATTLATLQWLGYRRSQAFAISFLVQWPLIVAGSLKGFLELRGTQIFTNILTMPFLLAIVSCMIISYGVMYKIGTIIENHSLWKFAYYMIIPVAGALCL